MTDLKTLTIEPHGDGHAVYSGRTSLTVNADGSLTFGTHGNRLFNVTDATEAGLQVAHEMVAAVNAVPELLALREEVGRLREALTWKPITEALKSGGPYLVTNNLNATLNDGSMSHVFLTRMIHQNGDEFSAYTDELRKVHRLSHFLPVARAALNQEPGQ